jgi:hypothetical protein
MYAYSSRTPPRACKETKHKEEEEEANRRRGREAEAEEKSFRRRADTSEA